MSEFPSPEFLSPEWIAGLDRIAAATPALADAEPVVIEQQVTGPAGAVTYHVVLGPGPARVVPGPAPAADLTIVVTEPAARAIHAGATNAQSCLADGTLRFRGNPEVLVGRAAVLAGVGDLFAPVRAGASGGGG